MSRVEICIAGYGGQGIILAGRILAEAAAGVNNFVVQSQDYGPQARGGSSKTVIIVSGDEIDYPEMTVPDILVALTQSAVDRLAGQLEKKSTLVGDTGAIRTWPDFDGHTLHLPLAATALDIMGKEIATGMVCLGAISALSHVVPKEALKKLIAKRVPPATRENNLAAFEAGYDLVSEAGESPVEVA